MPTEISRCTHSIVLDASLSTGGGAFPLLFHWEVHMSTADSTFAAASTEPYSPLHEVAVPPEVQRVEILLTVQNVAGESSSLTHVVSASA